MFRRIIVLTLIAGLLAISPSAVRAETTVDANSVVVLTEPVALSDAEMAEIEGACFIPSLDLNDYNLFKIIRDIKKEVEKISSNPKEALKMGLTAKQIKDIKKTVTMLSTTSRGFWTPVNPDFYADMVRELNKAIRWIEKNIK